MGKDRFVYIGGGFIESQYLWVIPIVCSFCKEKKINNIIFDDNIYQKVLKNKKIYYLLNKFNIIINKKNKNLLTNIIKKIFIIFKNIFEILNLVFSFKKKITSNKKNWFQSQIYHSYWDTALSMMKDNQIKPSLLQKILSALIICETIQDTNLMLKKYHIKYSFLGHSVYKFRVILSIFRNHNIQNYCQANYSFYLQDKYKDNSWNLIDNNTFKKISKRLNKNKVKKYWTQRISGRSNYEDANIASKIKKKISIYPKNVILLHIFKDSPFNVIDNNRIFYDYFEWIDKTFLILKHSTESWSIRIHPNSLRWGEDQKFIIKKLIDNHGLKNIILDNNYISNNDLFKNVKRVITFSGTSHLEASAFGIKPIVISEVTLSRLNINYVHKPKNLQIYKKLILCKSSNKIFDQKIKISKVSKELIYIRENLLTLKSKLGGVSIYRGDNIKIFIKEINLIRKNLDKNLHILKKIGINFSNGQKYLQ